MQPSGQSGRASASANNHSNCGQTDAQADRQADRRTDREQRQILRPTIAAGRGGDKKDKHVRRDNVATSVAQFCTKNQSIIMNNESAGDK